MEVAGIEPASRGDSMKASTCVSDYLWFNPPEPWSAQVSFGRAENFI